MVEKKNVKVRLYRFKNRLREKTAGLSGNDAKIPDDILAQAQAAFDDMAEDYPDWVSGLIDQLAERHRRCVDSPDDRRVYFEEINHIAHDMKGQGGTFGYPLITTFADSLSGFSYSKGNLTDDHVELIKAHIDSMRAVITNRVKGDGGEIGVELTKGLNLAIEKHKIS